VKNITVYPSFENRDPSASDEKHFNPRQITVNSTYKDPKTNKNTFNSQFVYITIEPLTDTKISVLARFREEYKRKAKKPGEADGKNQ